MLEIAKELINTDNIEDEIKQWGGLRSTNDTL
jgi:hypothetical protein